MRKAEVGVIRTRVPRCAPGRLPPSARQHVRLVKRLVMTQAGASAALTLAFSRRTVPVIVTTLVFVAVLCVLAALASTGTHTARTVVLGFESVVSVVGLYRFAFERYLAGTIFAIVIAAVLMHPAVIRSYGGASPMVADSSETAAEAAGGALGESPGH